MELSNVLAEALSLIEKDGAKLGAMLEEVLTELLAEVDTLSLKIKDGAKLGATLGGML